MGRCPYRKEYPKTSHLPDEVGQDDAVDTLIEEADDIRLKLGLDEITPICILTAICKTTGLYSLFKQLKSLPLREHEIFNLYRKDTPFTVSEDGNFSSLFSNGSDYSDSSFPSIKSYCVDRTAQARKGEIENIIGRDKELRMLVEILAAEETNRM